jgi:DNA-binding winged helix-turn-helix (wHTH) protein
VAPSTGPLRFPPFTLDPKRHVLTRDGDDVPLSPHLVDILIHLASRPGEIVTKDALLERFWPDVHITDNTLTRAIADIRKALADDPGSPRFIQTIARRGYRFVGALETPVVTDPLDPFREWARGRLSLEALDATRLPEAVASFESAVAAAPDYAPAHAGLANAYFLQFERTRAQNAPDREPLDRARRQAQRACEIDPALGEAWGTLAFVLTAVGEGEEARAAGRRASALEPTSWRHHFRLAIASWGEERLRAVDRTLSLFPDFAPARFLAAMVFIARQAFGPATDAAAAGASAQAGQTVGDGTAFPAIGLHWLHGLLLLRNGQIGASLKAFAREIDGATPTRIYGDEFRVNAQIAAGFAHLAAKDPPGATDAFRAALEIFPRNGRALIGLYQALSDTVLAPESHRLLPQIEQSIAELSAGGRRVEAAIVTAAACAARGEIDAGCATLQTLLDAAPPGQAGWLLPVDPALAPLRSAPGFSRIAAQLSARAS